MAYYNPYQYPYYSYQSNPNNYTMPQQQSYAQPQPTQSTAQGMVFVQPISGGENEAKTYPVAAGATMWLVDYEERCIYVKTMDASGMPLPLRVFEFNEVVRTEPPAIQQSNFNPDEYVRKEEFEEMKKQLQNMNSRKDRTNGKQSVQHV